MPERVPVAALKRFTRIVDRCDHCRAPLEDDHRHAVEPDRGRVVCLCEPCLLRADLPAIRRFARRISASTDVERLLERLPVDVAVIARDGVRYPSPAGPIKADVEGLQVAAHEALFVDRRRGLGPRMFSMSVDLGHTLFARVRSNGVVAIDAFVRELEELADAH